MVLITKDEVLKVMDHDGGGWGELCFVATLSPAVIQYSVDHHPGEKVILWVEELFELGPTLDYKSGSNICRIEGGRNRVVLPIVQGTVRVRWQHRRIPKLEAFEPKTRVHVEIAGAANGNR